MKVTNTKKLRADQIQGMPATSWFKVFCLTVCYQKSYRNSSRSSFMLSEFCTTGRHKLESQNCKLTTTVWLWNVISYKQITVFCEVRPAHFGWSVDSLPWGDKLKSHTDRRRRLRSIFWPKWEEMTHQWRKTAPSGAPSCVGLDGRMLELCGGVWIYPARHCQQDTKRLCCIPWPT